MLQDFGRTYELTFWPRPRATRLRLDLSEARRLLVRAMGDAVGMRELRRMLATRSSGAAVPRLSDAEVIEQLAARIAKGVLRAYAEPVVARTYGAEEKGADEALAPWSVQEPDEAPVDDRLDVEAQVAAMKNAARKGVPFCEECEKARLAAAAAKPAPDPYAGTDVAAQAAVLKEAAQGGAPFCEECEKARLAAAAEAAKTTPAPDPYAGTDVAAQAAVLKEAAQSGAPFCEECARLAREKAAAEAQQPEAVDDAPAAFANADVAAQAGAMRAAADEGTPFCEECEKARQKAAAQAAAGGGEPPGADDATKGQGG
jgi:hypothetical protein